MVPFPLVRLLVAGTVLASLGGLPDRVVAADLANPPAAVPGERSAGSQLTLKERSSRKAMDEQRVNDCKVPLDQRGDGCRPAECGRK